jgi:methylase of polypeptide subunit release factors
MLASYLLMQSTYTFIVSRLDLQHYAMQYITGKQFFAPITEPKRAVDIGTGTGIWMLASICTAYVSHSLIPL